MKKRQGLLAVVSAGFPLVVYACSSADPHPKAYAPGPLQPAPSGTFIAKLPSDGAASDGTAKDGGADAPDADLTALCSNMPTVGQEMEEIAVAGTPPTPAGGTISAGLYSLTAVEAWNSTADAGSGTGTSERYTLVVTTTSQTSGTMVFAGTRGNKGSLGANTTTGYSWTQAAGAQIELTQVCPQSMPAKSLSFTASGNSLALFQDGNHRETFSR